MVHIFTILQVNIDNWFASGFEDSKGNHPEDRLLIAAWIVIGLSWMSSVLAMTQSQIGNYCICISQLTEYVAVNNASWFLHVFN